MGNSLLNGIALDDTFFSFFSNFLYVSYVLLSLIFSTALVFLLWIIYKKIRRKFPLKVNCWFCNSNVTIPYDLYNAWDCPHCKQYNGFTKDGDYNKSIPEQYNNKLNENIFATLKPFNNCKETSSYANGFCKLCNINQQLKIQQLALFVPINENNYFDEIEKYREKLELAYKLCTKCEKILQDTLEKQKYNLLRNSFNSQKDNSTFLKNKVLKKIGKNDILVFIKKNGILGLSVIHTVLGILLFVVLVLQYETENQIFRFSSPESNLEPWQPFIEELFNWNYKIYFFRKEVSFAGLLSCFLVQLQNNFIKNNIILLSWTLLHVLFWSTLTGFQVVISGFNLLLSIQALRIKIMNNSVKSRPIKLGRSPVEKVFPEVSKFKDYNNPISSESSPILKNENCSYMEENSDLFDGNIKKSEEKPMHAFYGERKKKQVKKNENEIESLPNEEKEKSETTSMNFSTLSFSKKSPVSSGETSTNNVESSGPLNEVFNTLNSLQLGGKQKKSNKPPNFLFANHNFTEKRNSSIIKPAKLIKNLNSSSWTESNEGNSRSSTPSSGYFSQKPEKSETSRYDFPKTISPITVNPFNRHSPNNCFDYYDGNQGFYNMNSFSPGLASFQYPGPMGHTTIYTYTRPGNFPFPFPPWYGYPSQKFSPTSPRFSDASDCDNLFQESSKHLVKHQKWSKLKSFLYSFSIFLNLITAVSLIYFASMGIILVDWKPPKLNFFA